MQPKFLIAGTLLLLSAALFSQNSYNPWSYIDPSTVEQTGARLFRPDKYRDIRLDVGGARSFLWSAPHEKDTPAKESDAILTLPMPDGSWQDFRIVAYDMMEPGLAARYPDIRTFYGVCTARGYGKVYLDWTSFGLRASFSTPAGKVYIDPQYQGNRKDYFCYFKQDYPQPEEPFVCGVEDEVSKKFLSQAGGPEIKAGDCVFRTYRLAIAVTGEYSNFFGVTDASGSATILSAVTAIINRVNQVYEKDFTIRLLLIANTEDVFYYDPDTDPFTNGSPNAMIMENQQNMDDVIQNPNYDIGHVFGTQGGGLASLNGPCNNNKASAMTGLNNPVGDAFAIDYVAHEMGHQFGATHTQNNDCNRSLSSSMEPGSASTIMGYAGICAPNVQSFSDDYFHAVSLQQVAAFVASETCNGTLALANNAPAIDPLLNRIIPGGTPFVLTAFGNDPDSDPLTYCWEQFDPEVGEVMPPEPGNTQGPMFRSLLPTSSTQRYFPNLTDLTANVAPTWEVLSEVDKAMNFIVTARDGDNSNTGCTGEAEMTVTVDGNSGPFQVLAPNTAVDLTEGQYEQITWDVAQTDKAPVNCDNVDILLSYDGGFTYPVTLASGIPNNGIAYVLFPATMSTTARIMVKCSDNIFFDISDLDFNINDGGVNFGLGATPAKLEVCLGDPVEFTILTNSFGGFVSPITLAVTSFPPGSAPVLGQVVVLPGQSTTLTLLNALALGGGSYTFTLTAIAPGGLTKSIDLYLDILDGPVAPILDFPANGATQIPAQPYLTWNGVPLSDDYRIEISPDPTFTTNVFSDVALDTAYQKIADLDPATTYYWRVRGSDKCTIGDWSGVYSFTTTDCITVNSTDVPKNISQNGTPTVTSTLEIADAGYVVDVNVINLAGTHSWISDLSWTLIGPGATPTEDVLFYQICNNENDFNFGADDNAASGTPPCPPVDGANYRPTDSLSVFLGQSITGTWTLQVNDHFDNDGGELTSWGLRVCYSPTPILPVELMQFDAEPLTSAIRLTWSTAAEVNSAGFELLRRSATEQTFRRIGWLDSRGDKNRETHYFFDDTDVRPGVRYYYQLNQLDFDGKSTLSEVVSAEIRGKGQWSVSPNPVSGGSIRLRYEGNDQGERSGMLRVFNAQGMLIREVAINGSAFQLKTDDLPTGIYLLTIDDQAGRQIETIIRT